MTQLEQSIYDIVAGSKGMKAKQIATKLGIDKSIVNSILCNNLKGKCRQDVQYMWHTVSATTTAAAPLGATALPLGNISAPDHTLERLCKYYLNCLSLEVNDGVSAFLTGNYDLNYAEVSGLDPSHFNSPAAVQLFKRTSGQRNMTTYVGYPTLIEKIHSRTGQVYLMVAPVFLFSVEYNHGNVTVAGLPTVNKEVISKYSSKDINDRAYALVELEDELGLNEANAEIELDDLVARLQQIRQWDWQEILDPNMINILTPIGSIKQEGIYNRAIVIAAERSPFTQGLESELMSLSRLSELEYRDTALYKWIHHVQEPSAVSNPRKNIDLLEVLPLNSEQEQAVSAALGANLTIVTGPPGTGKSQVVTDLLINAAWKDKAALFTSKNNKAVDVVDLRVNSLSPKPIMLRIGSNQYATRLAELIEGLLSSSPDQMDRDDYSYYDKAYKEKLSISETLKKKKEQIVSLRNQLDRAEQRIDVKRDRWGEFYGKVSMTEIETMQTALNKLDSSFRNAQKRLQPLTRKMIWFVVKNKRIKEYAEQVFAVGEMMKKYGLNPPTNNAAENEYQQFKSEIVDCISSLKLLAEYNTLQQSVKLADSLESLDKQLSEQRTILADIAIKLWKKWLVTRPLNMTSTQRMEMAQYVSAMKLIGDVDLKDYPDVRSQFSKLQKEMAKYLPCWAVTSLSARGRIPFQSGMFDLVIIDEASQCDIASILPLLYRAKRAVIIGDPKQLSHISSITKAQDTKLLQKYEVGFEWSYSTQSLYNLASSMSNPDRIINLRDHHRSFGDIIEFSNREFYDGKLRIATNYSKLKVPINAKAGIRWVNTIGTTIRPPDGGAFNNAEISGILTELRQLVVKNGYIGSVGVVTPFRVQAKRIQEAIENDAELRNYLYARNDFLVDTVHKFQGDEKDIIFFSPTISQGTPDSAIGFLNSTGNLFNVAITRARSMLVVVGDMQYCATCKVPYMEHFVVYVNKLGTTAAHSAISDQFPGDRVYPHVSNLEQVSEWERHLYTALFDAGIRTIPQYPAEKYKLDLALFESERKLDIEIDGEMYHRDWNGELCYRDQLRNQRLYEMGWDVKRFWVYQIRDELPWCVEQIKQWQGMSQK